MRLKSFLFIILSLLFFSGQSFAEGSKFDRFANDAEAAAQTRNDVGLTPANIPFIMATPGTISTFQLDHNIELLNADRTILITDKPIQWYDPDGVGRNVILPAEASSTDLVFTFYNDADGAGEDLVIRDDTPTTLITIGPGQGAEVSCDGTSWKVLNSQGIYYDAVSNKVGIRTTTPDVGVTIGEPFVVEHMTTGDDRFKVSDGTISFNMGGGYATVANSGALGARMNIGPLSNSGYAALALTGVASPTANIFEVNSIGDQSGDFFVIDKNGNVGISTIAPDTLLELQKESVDAEETISVYHDTEATASIITLRKADNTAAAPALVDDNAVLGRINFKGHDGSGWHTGAKIEARVDGTPSDGTDMPTELVFSTTADGAGSPTERLIIQPDGTVILEPGILGVKETTTPSAASGYGKVYTKTDNTLYFQDGAGVEHAVSPIEENYGEAYIYNNAVVTVIETADTPIALRQISSGLVHNFTFDAGGTGAVTAYSDYSGTVAGTVNATDVGHGLVTGDIITIRGTTNYNGVFEITRIDDNEFYFTDTWVVDDGASDWDQGASLTYTGAATAIHSISWQMSTFPAAGCTVTFIMYKNTTPLTKSTAERKFAINDLGSTSSSCVCSIANGDVIWLTVQSDDTANITNKHGEFNLRRL